MIIEPSRQLQKNDLRLQLRQKRTGVEPGQRQAWDASINRHVLDFAATNPPRLVAAFMGFDGEPDLAPSLNELDRLGIRLALPVVRDGDGRAEICFRRWSPSSEMRPNRYGIAEPVGTLDVRLDEIDLALIPLVAWDSRGGRLGMGASFYDRLFQPLADLDRPFRMGVAYHLQQVDHLPLDPWDIRLHAMLTENGSFTCAP